MADRMLVVQVDSTVELPSEPDSGFPAAPLASATHQSKHECLYWKLECS